jgi:Ca-activated chloride channel family protein
MFQSVEAMKNPMKVIMRLFSRHCGVRSIIPIILIGILLPILLSAQPGRGKVKEGNKLYKEQKFDAAQNKYQDALLENPNSPLIQFNVGDVIYKKKDYQKAMESFQKTLKSNDVNLQSKTCYNLGNTLYQMNKLPESILEYQQALKLNPNDQDAKYNLEYVRNKLKQNSQPQQQNPQNQQQQQQQNQQNQNDQKKQDQKQQEKQPQEQQQKKEMSKEQAEQILKALNEKQKNQKEQQVPYGGETTVEKDW